MTWRSLFESRSSVLRLSHSSSRQVRFRVSSVLSCDRLSSAGSGSEMFARNFGSVCLLVAAVLAVCSASRMDPDPEGPCAARLQRSLIAITARIVPTCVDRGCHVVSTITPPDVNLSLLDRSCYFLPQVAPRSSSRGWVSPCYRPTAGFEPWTFRYVSRNSDRGGCCLVLQCGLSARPGRPTNCCRKSPHCLDNDGVDSRCV
uniref:(California timema) hypothetical protein n=1 Tax=Timema californicum TaxID=61474 RepID=A0A7R9JH59_TIMCA|nr:unnamed protein product [Timema californicum]